MGTHKASEDQQPTGEDTEDKDYKDLKGDSILESVENGDGSVDVILSDDKEAPAAKTGFYDNIASNLPADRLSRLSLDLADLMDRDQTARENRDKDQAQGIRRLGLVDGESGVQAAIENGSTLQHPMMIEACVDFASKSIKELFPSAGPVRDWIPGTATKAKVDKARRKTRYLNFLTTKRMKEFRSELEQALSQLPMSGDSYLKFRWDNKLRRVLSEFIPDDKILLPYSASSFLSAERKAHIIEKTENELESLIKSGQYVDPGMATSTLTETTQPQRESDKIAGITEDGENVDGIRKLFEIYIMSNSIEDDADDDKEDGGEEGNEDDESSEPDYKPYIVVLDDSSHRIVAVYRNWKEDDKEFKSMDSIVQFPFVPWRGPHSLSLNALIGSLSAAASGALRGLLDSAMINNTPSALKLEGGSKGSQTISVGAGELVTIEGSMQADDIRKVIMPLPFNPPSPTLFQLLQWLTDAGKGVVATTFEGLADQKTDMPVGTTLALIEQGMTVYSAIHARLHRSMGDCFEIIHRLCGMNLSEDSIMDDFGELIVKREDFQGPMDVQPVSDPLIFSEVQRQAHVAFIAQRAMAMPAIYDAYKVEERILESSRIPNAKDLLVARPEPKKMNAINENVSATIGRGLVVFPDQDHISHIRDHLSFMKSPILGSNAAFKPIIYPAMAQHLRDHLAFWYLSRIYETASAAASIPVEHLIDDSDPEITSQFDKMLSEASQSFMQVLSTGQYEGSELISTMPAEIQQVIQFVQQSSQQQQPADPRAQAQMAEVQRKTQKDQVDNQLAQGEQQAKQGELQLKAQELASRDGNDKAKLSIEQGYLQQSAQTNAAQVQTNNAQAQAAAQDRQNQTMLAKQQQDMENQSLVLDHQEKQEQRDADERMQSEKNSAELYKLNEQQAADETRSNQDNAVKIQIARENNDLAMDIVDKEIAAGKRTNIKNGDAIKR